MSVLPVGIGSEAGGYQIERSLRFNSADSAYLNRTLTTPTNNKIFTFSAWVKRSGLGANQNLLDAYVPATSFDTIRFNSSDQLEYFDNTAGYLTSTPVYRDVGSWYHIVAAVDTTQATSSNRVKLYVNGTQVTAFSATAYPSLNQAIIFNSAVVHDIGRFGYSANAYLSGYLADVYFIDGSALTPSSFGETDTDTGVWKPKAYSGSYGTNGFYLDFGDNSSTTALGYDAAGSNDWTPNNFSVTAGAGNDSLVDSPTRYGTDTGAGGEVRGNYATLNPLDTVNGTFSNGNLAGTVGTGGASVLFGSIAMTSGKYYFEVTVGANADHMIGVADQSQSISSRAWTGANGWYYYTSGQKYNNSTGTSYGSSYATNDIVGVAYDADAGSLTFYKNGVSQGVAFSSGLAGKPIVFALGNGSGSATQTININFGQRPFAYTAPSGFKALCTTNLPEPTIAEGRDYFNAVLYTGNGSTQSITGVGFQPDLVWAKCRSNSYHHKLVDAVRGTTLTLSSSQTSAEQTEANSLTAFNSDGFSLGNISSMNASAETFVAWNWKANGAGSSNTAGTISSTVSANTTAGFSIVTYTGTGSNGTVGHGLGVAPAMVIVKQRNGSTYSWTVQHTSVAAGSVLALESTSAAFSRATSFNSTYPTSTVFSLGTDLGTNSSSGTYVAYCFAPIAGYSAFGSYTGNGSSDGVFVHLNFKPKFWMSKRTDSTSSWLIVDGARNTYNIVDDYLIPNSSGAEGSANVMDFLSNGIKLRSTTHNDSGATWIYMAFAENPFKFSLAR